MRKLVKIVVAGMLCTLAWACSTTRHVPDGQMLLDAVNIVVDDSTSVRASDLQGYLRQTPNHKIFGFWKLQLNTYSLSGRDTTKWYNRWLRRLGQAPVVYDEALTEMSRQQLTQALVNMGYMDAKVNVDSVARHDKKKIKLAYNVHPGTPHRLSSVTYDVADSAIAALIARDSSRFALRSGDLFDRNMLDAERSRITRLLHNNGYYSFTKECISFIADTAANSYDVDLTLVLDDYKGTNNSAPRYADSHEQYVVNKVYFVTNAPSLPSLTEPIPEGSDIVEYKGINVVYGEDHYILPSALDEKCFIVAGEPYRAWEVDRTYEALAQLGILKSINIQMIPVAQTPDGTHFLNAYIYLSRNKKQSATLELEGTNSEGDLGFGLGLTYNHRNVGHRSNLLTTKLRVSYESLSGDLSGLINDRYTEYAAEAGLTFPKFLFPFLSKSYKQRVKASTEVAASFNYQERPEYTRIIAGAAWKYKWAKRNGMERLTWDLVDVNYVYLPKSTLDFIDKIAPTNPLLRYSYQDHFIMRMGFNYYRTNKRIATSGIKRYSLQPRVYTLRVAAETAGNLLYAFSSMCDQGREDGVYKIFGIQYAQYAKADVDYSLSCNLSQRHSLAFRAGFGIGVPYGNSRVLPFEKRFYGGGANGVRGWSVRSLGPGCFDSRNSVANFMDQCGDIRLDLSAEYRMKLFWVIEGALFVDAGNIWTIHNYENQPGGVFKFDTFWRQIALAYGAGVRLDFSYFLLRLDLGMKAHDPARGHEPWPLIHPNWKRDATFHFAVGYPF